MKSEFDTYSNLTYVPITGGHWCIERQRYIKTRPIEQAQLDSDSIKNRVDNLANRAARQGEIDLMNRAEKLLTNQVDAKIDLQLRYPYYELN